MFPCKLINLHLGMFSEFPCFSSCYTWVVLLLTTCVESQEKKDEAYCIDVEILSRCLEAKLTVCYYSLSRDKGSRKEDDWTYPSCGNVNFSFRTTCNMRNCTQSRADHNSKSAAKPIQPMHGYSSSAPYVGSGAPSSMYMGVPPYGSSLFNGSSMSPYDVPFSGGSAYPYNYGSRLSGSIPYKPLHIAGPTPYSSGSMIGNDAWWNKLVIEFFPDDKYQKKDGTLDNDWTCPKCGNVNFSFRTVCNMRKCNTPKPRPQV